MVMYNRWQEKSMISFSGKLWASFISQHSSVIFHLLYPPFNLWPEARSLPCHFAPFSRPTELIPDQRWSTQRSWPSSAPWAYVLGTWPHDSSEVALFRKMWHSLRAVKDGVRISFYWHFVRVTPSSALRLTAAQKRCGSEVHSGSFSC